MAFTPNAKKVFMIMYFTRKFDHYGGWMRIQTIQKLCEFEKAASVVGSLLALQRQGLVEKEKQTLLDGTVFNFYRIVDSLLENITVDFSNIEIDVDVQKEEEEI